ncbi:phage tail terminator protein [Paramagnetospirillum magneticum]|uniref:Uncharacterized protein n=1 Tax=Paramagnetospirillum magneticum (strain ATCC 700264 / AMB-1) TaxID=342108 RepID=Q2W6E9_PARM1|nr:hypothetical protein [Paramagnetospirillum magneticum]BAE50576.1 hypothetical protein amb1772 [Paramagnetospirillum magneticum AMB-1]
MIDLDPVNTRIADIKTAGNKKRFLVVGDAIGYAAATKKGAMLGDGPNAYVLPVADLPAAIPPEGGPQGVYSEFKVMIFKRLFGNATGTGVNKELIAIEKDLLATLLGWSPNENLGPITFAGAGLADFADGELWWGMTFRTTYGLMPTIRSF